MKEIIQKAIKGGWKNKQYGFDCGIDTYEHYVCDPLFWQALGKALKWDTEIDYFVCQNVKCNEHKLYPDEWLTYSFCPKCGGTMKQTKKYTKSWLNYWHRFIDYLAENNEDIESNGTESYFKKLINEALNK